MRCLFCRRPFKAKHANTKLCSKRCRRSRQRKMASSWTQSHADQVRTYKRDWMREQRNDPAYRAAEQKRERKLYQAGRKALRRARR